MGLFTLLCDPHTINVAVTKFLWGEQAAMVTKRSGTLSWVENSMGRPSSPVLYNARLAKAI